MPLGCGQLLLAAARQQPNVVLHAEQMGNRQALQGQQSGLVGTDEGLVTLQLEPPALR
jgi:hypothetical protein